MAASPAAMPRSDRPILVRVSKAVPGENLREFSGRPLARVAAAKCCVVPCDGPRHFAVSVLRKLRCANVDVRASSAAEDSRISKMSRRIEIFNADGVFSHYGRRADAVLAVREGQADWAADGYQHRLLMRPKILCVRGRLGIWAPVRCSDPSIPRVEGCAPKFSVLQLV